MFRKKQEDNGVKTPSYNDGLSVGKANKVSGRRKKGFSLFSIFIYIMIALAIALTVTAVWGVGKFRDMMDQSYAQLNNGIDAVEVGKPVKVKELESFNLLILGVDSRGGEASRSDTIIIASINPHTEEILLTSLPRDTYTSIPGYYSTKVNAAMALGGASLAKETLETGFGLTIDHYMTVDFQGFQKAIDVLDGVTIDVEKRMYYNDPTDGTHINLQPGEQILDGKNALDYVRFRADNLGDYGRMERQQKFIKATLDELTKFNNVTKLLPFVSSIGEGVKTDLHRTHIESLIKKFFGVDGSAISSQVYESHSYTGTDGLWYEEVTVVERERIARVIADFLNKKKDVVKSSSLGDDDEIEEDDAN